MATYTTNYNLKKPDSTEPFGDFRGDYNDNLDIIDANLGGGGGSSSLAGLSDVNLTTPTDGQVLTYDGNSSKWVNANGGGGGGGGLVYSETEQVIGEFCGKPLYQKCIPFSGLTLYANSVYAFNISSYIPDYKILFPQWDMTYYFVSNVERSFTSMTVEPPNVILVVPVTRTNISGHIVMRYTKTTD